MKKNATHGIEARLPGCLHRHLFCRGSPAFRPGSHERFEQISRKDFLHFPLVELECLVVPLREDRQILVDRYEQFFRQCEQLEMTPASYRMAAELRAQNRLKTPDALHLATASSCHCYEIWTNDDRLRSIPGGMAINLFSGIR
ncbi:MAG: PIN domain-containing protein [Burkholderiales bacterium]|nr:PIN domain-containing protein [Burkholderiales bacterium]MBY0579183.1 PIN domain-containing protein [Burkholderiales bacterium]